MTAVDFDEIIADLERRLSECADRHAALDAEEAEIRKGIESVQFVRSLYSRDYVPHRESDSNPLLASSAVKKRLGRPALFRPLMSQAKERRL